MSTQPAELTAEEKNQRIAEHLGCERGSNGWIVPLSLQWLLEDGMVLPAFFHDLNAMHEAEKALSDLQWLDGYFQNLNFVVGSPPLGAGLKPHIHATAAQRAEAFGRTLNLW